MATKKKSPKKKTAKKKKAAKKKAVKKIENNQKSKTDKRANNGGARNNSGRKVGAATQKTREIADKLVADGELTPLEYMLGILRETPDDLKKQFEAGEIDLVEYTLKLKMMISRKDQAAEKAAPYVHPRLASIQATVTDPEHERWLAMINAIPG